MSLAKHRNVANVYNVDTSHLINHMQDMGPQLSTVIYDLVGLIYYFT